MKGKILSVAGLDPSGGAGVLVDFEVAREHDYFCYTAVTSLTSQSSIRVTGVYPVESEILKETFSVLSGEGKISGLKLGLLPKVSLAKVVKDFILNSQIRPVVCDPVLNASDGTRLVSKEMFNFYKNEIFPLVDIVTYNVMEAEIFTGLNIEHLEELVARLSEFNPRFVIKGGHYQKHRALDFVYDNGDLTSMSLPVLEKEARGTGCAYSTSLLCCLLNGLKLEEAAKSAKNYVYEKIKTSQKLGQGSYQFVWG